MCLSITQIEIIRQHFAVSNLHDPEHFFFARDALIVTPLVDGVFRKHLALFREFGIADAFVFKISVQFHAFILVDLVVAINPIWAYRTHIVCLIKLIRRKIH